MVEYNLQGGVVFSGSRILMPVAVATILAAAQGAAVSGTLGVGTIGTIQSAVGVVGTVQAQAASYRFLTASGTVKASAGVLYSVLVAGETGIAGGAAGTLLVLDSAGTIAVVPVASGGFNPAQFGPGINFGSLFGSIIGSLDATFVYT